MRITICDALGQCLRTGAGVFCENLFTFKSIILPSIHHSVDYIPTRIDWLCFIDHECLSVPSDSCDAAKDSLRA